MLLFSNQVIRPALLTGILLLIPLVSMHFTHEVAWTTLDFVAAGALLFATGFAFELLAGHRKNAAYRLAVAAALGTALLLVWSNLAVGILGSENNPLNWLYVGVLLPGFVGALAARFRPHGMAKALSAAALAQLLITVGVLAFHPHRAGAKPLSTPEVLTINAFFIMLWVVAALLFQRAGRLPAVQ